MKEKTHYEFTSSVMKQKNITDYEKKHNRL
jgi:hypothetical protein